jgi:hypothetical protein
MGFSMQLQNAILYTLAYADVFDYPLTAHEIYRYLTGLEVSFEEVSQVLEEQWHGLFIQDGDYFMLPGRTEIIAIRRRRAKNSSRLWPKAVRYGRWIASLPFVRMVAITGSLAMNNLEQGKDIDYMIVTAAHRLWTCRALSLLIVRFAKLGGLQLCPNYLVTQDALELRDHSLYAAHELTQMISLSGSEIYHTMRHLNMWTNEYLPNAQGAPNLSIDTPRFNFPLSLQRVFEFILNILQVQWFERWEMNRKIKKLSREQSLSAEAFFSADVCKGHVDRHGFYTEQALRERLETFSLELIK